MLDLQDSFKGSIRVPTGHSFVPPGSASHMPTVQLPTLKSDSVHDCHLSCSLCLGFSIFPRLSFLCPLI